MSMAKNYVPDTFDTYVLINQIACSLDMISSNMTDTLQGLKHCCEALGAPTLTEEIEKQIDVLCMVTTNAEELAKMYKSNQ